MQRTRMASSVNRLVIVASLVSTCLLSLAFSLNLDSAEDQNYIVQLHNNARNEENAKNMNTLVWDADLAANAQAWTDQCEFKHMTGQSWGENLSAVGHSAGQTTTIALDRLFGLWMAEKKYNTGGTFEECCGKKAGKCCHYTQVIWSKSSKVGCGMTRCPQLASSFRPMTNMIYLACFYDPRGNKPAVTYTFDWRPYIPQK